jgi:hypothetical protein
MSLLDLAFEYDIKIDFDGDFDGGTYYMKLNYITSTQGGTGDTTMTITLKQDDIVALYDGAKQLIRALEKHILPSY